MCASDKRRRLFALSAVLLCAASVVFYVLYLRCQEQKSDSGNMLPESSGGMTVAFLDVGEGDSVIVTADGETMLVDGGLPEYSDLIYTYLKENSIDHLKYVFCTHPHADHAGGLSGALEYAKADEAFCCVREYGSKSFESFIEHVRQQGLELKVPEVGTALKLGGASVTVISPAKEYEELNDCSLVLRIDYGKVSVLLTGDAGYDAEIDMMGSQFPLRADLLKVGHHGSGSSSYYYFLREVSPSYSVISVGKDNEHGHPSEYVIEKLRDIGSQVFRTDKDGTVVFRSDGNTVWPEKTVDNE